MIPVHGYGNELIAFLSTQVPMMGIAWMALLPVLISALGLLRGNGSSSTGGVGSTSLTTQTADTNMTAILDLQRRRMELQNPLFEAVQRLAMGLMPTAYQTGNTALGGGTLPGVPRVPSTGVDFPWEPHEPSAPVPRPYIPDPFNPDTLRRGYRNRGREY